MASGMAASTTKLSYEDFVLFPDDGKRHELIDGEHFVTPSPNLRHQVVLQNLNRALDAFVRERGLGRVFFAPLDVLLTPHDVVEPDLMFVSAARSEVLTAANVQGAPDLVVEVVSPSSRRHDELRKRDLYERGGVTEYWVVDPEVEEVKLFRRRLGREPHEGGGPPGFDRPALLIRRDGDVLASPLLAGFELPLAAVFAE